MTKEMLAEMAKRIEANNKQLLNDIEVMQKERKDAEEGIDEQFQCVIHEICDLLSVIPADCKISKSEKVKVHWRSEASSTETIFACQGFKYYYQRSKYECSFYTSFIRNDGVWQYSAYPNDKRSVEEKVNLISWYRERKDIIMNDIKSTLEAYNDQCIEMARKEVEKTSEYISASVEEK